jgi:hypothetical protein
MLFAGCRSCNPGRGSIIGAWANASAAHEIAKIATVLETAKVLLIVLIVIRYAEDSLP